jgi:hypothetical protein
MAEFLGQTKPSRISTEENSGFNAMGKPIPIERKKEAYKHLKAMGVEDTEECFRCIRLVADRLERDDPYGAMEQAMKYVDLTGTYRLMAVLLT